MKRWTGWQSPALLLTLAATGAHAAPPPAGQPVLPAVAAVQPETPPWAMPGTGIATADRIEVILEDQRRHGYPSVQLALQRLLAAGQVPAAGWPRDLRRRYYGELSRLADLTGRPELSSWARDRLQEMAREDACLPCRAELLVARAHRAISDRDDERAQEYLAEADRLTPAADGHLRLKLAYVEVLALEASGHSGQAIERAVAAVARAEQMGSTARRIDLLTVLTGLNADLGYHDRALAFTDEVMELAGPLGYTEAVALAWLNRGHIHSLMGEREQQLHALKQALSITADVPGLERTEVLTRSNLADYYLYRDDHATALTYARQAVGLARQAGHVRGLTVALANAGIAQSHLGRLEEGVDTLRESLALARSIDNKVYVASINRELARVLERAGRYQEALEAMRRVTETNAEITREEREQAVLEVQERYASERKNREIERLEAENRAKEAELDARAWRQRLWAVLALAFALAATLLVQWLSRSQRVNRRLKNVNASLAEETMHDPLTRVFNRRHFNHLMNRLAAVPDTTVGLMVLDIDHFKRINDHHGHETGDRVLVEVAHRLSALLREQDSVVRWGGEEFVLVLPGTTADGLVVLAERVLRTLGEVPVRCGNRQLPITVSIGAVAHPLRPGDPWQDAFRLADAAMYLGKQSGRNRAICVMAMAPDTRPGQAAIDLPSAEREGMLTLERVIGTSVIQAFSAA